MKKQKGVHFYLTQMKYFTQQKRKIFNLYF